MILNVICQEYLESVSLLCAIRQWTISTVISSEGRGSEIKENEKRICGAGGDANILRKTIDFVHNLRVPYNCQPFWLT